MKESGGSFSIQVCHQAEAPCGWDALVTADPGADFFHTSAWTTLAARCYPRLQPFWLTVHRADRLVAGLAGMRRRDRLAPVGQVDRWESHLEGASGGPVIAGELDDQERAQLFDLLIDCLANQGAGFLRRWSVSLNTAGEQLHGHALARRGDWHRRAVPGAVIDLSAGLETFEMSAMKKNKRNERNRGLKRGLASFVTHEVRWLREYYPLYKAASRTWGMPPVPLEFLSGLLGLGAERSFFTCVTCEERVVGGHLNLVHGDRVLAWNGVTDPSLARTHFPATVAVWQDAVEACRRGARLLDLGASGGVVSLEGFKKNFGATFEDRGFYVKETAALRLLSGVRHLWSAGRRPGTARWHDTEGPS